MVGRMRVFQVFLVGSGYSLSMSSRPTPAAASAKPPNTASDTFSTPPTPTPTTNGANGGPLQQAYDQKSNPRLGQEWLASSPSERSLDPADIPPDILATLDTVQIFLDLPYGSAGGPGEMHVVRVDTPYGVAAEAAASVGPSILTAGVRPEDFWTVSFEEYGGSDSVLLGTVPSSVIQSLQEQDTLVIHIPAATLDEAQTRLRNHDSTSGGVPGFSYTIENRAAIQQRLAEMAAHSSAGGTGPEPTESAPPGTP